MSVKSIRTRAKVLFDFEADYEGGLNVSEGDIVDVLVKQEDGWSKCRLKAKIGLLPTDFLEIITPDVNPTPPPVPLSRPTSVQKSNVEGKHSGNNSKGNSKNNSTGTSKSFPMFDDYMCTQLIGEGGFGKVYLGKKIANQEEVAIKLTKCEDDFEFNRNLKEALNILKLSHEYVVPIDDAFKYSDQYGETFICIAMPYFKYGSLDREIFGKKEKIPESIILDVATQQSSALAFIHGRKMIHRDIKPHNILIESKTPTSMKTVLSDFGLSRNIDLQMSMTHAGTMIYMSPEMRNNEKFCEKADIWALGCVLYQMMKREMKDMCTYMFFTMSKQKDWQQTLLNDMKDYSPKLAKIVAKMLDADEKQRPSAKEIYESLVGNVEKREDPLGHLNQQMHHLNINQTPIQPNIPQQPVIPQRPVIQPPIIQQPIIQPPIIQQPIIQPPIIQPPIQQVPLRPQDILQQQQQQKKSNKITFQPNEVIWSPMVLTAFQTSNQGYTVKKVLGANQWTDANVFLNKSFSSTLGGKYYMEFKIENINKDQTGMVIGITSNITNSYYKTDIGIGMKGYAYNVLGSEQIIGNIGDRIGMLLDMDVCELLFYKNGKKTDNYAKLNPGTTYYPVAHIYYIHDSVTATFPSIDQIQLEESIQSLQFYQDLLDAVAISKYFPYYPEEQQLNPKFPMYFQNSVKTITKIGGGNRWEDAPIFIPRKFTMSPGQGRGYWEIIINSINKDRTGMVIGVTKDFNTSHYKTDYGIGMTGIKNGGVTGNDTLAVRNGDVIGVLLNCDDGILKFFKNGKELNFTANIPRGTSVYPVIHLYYIQDKITVNYTSIEEAQTAISALGVLPYSGRIEPLTHSSFSIIGNQTILKVSGGNRWYDAPVFIDNPLNLQNGKVYWEVHLDRLHSDQTGMVIGITPNKQSSYFNKDIAVGMKGYTYGVSKSEDFIAKSGDRIGVLVDFDNLMVHFYRNGAHTTYSSSISRNVNYYPVVHLYYMQDQVTIKYPSLISALKSSPSSTDHLFSDADRKLVPAFPNTFSLNQSFIKKITGGNRWTDAAVFLDKKLNFTSGRVYWEVVIHFVNSDRTGMVIGITSTPKTSYFKTDIGIGMSCYKYGGITGNDNWTVQVGDRIGVLVDYDSSIIKFYKNGSPTTLQGKIQKGVDYWPVIHLFYIGDSVQVTFPNPPSN